MHNLNLAMKNCIKDLEAINVPIRGERIKSFFACSELNLDKGCWGYIYRYDDGTDPYPHFNSYEIAVDKELLNSDNPLSSLKNILIHELLHTCPGCFNHGLNWIQIVNYVNQNSKYHVEEAESFNSLKLKHYKIGSFVLEGIKEERELQDCCLSITKVFD